MADERLLKEKYARLYEEHKKREQLVDAAVGDILALLYDQGITIGEAERIFDSIRDEMYFRARRLCLNEIMEPENASGKNEKG